MVGEYKVGTNMRTLGVSSHAVEPRQEDDYYATPREAVEKLLEVEQFKGPVWENSCGAGHISEVLKAEGYEVVSTDLVDRGYGESGIDFLKEPTTRGKSIVMNPPYKLAQEFIEHSLDLIGEGGKVAAFLKLTFLASQGRKETLYKENPPRYVYVMSKRVTCAKNGDFEKYKGKGAVEYAWFIWEKGYKGSPEVKWL